MKIFEEIVHDQVSAFIKETVFLNDRQSDFFFLFFSICLDDPHLTNEHRTQDCIAS